MMRKEEKVRLALEYAIKRKPYMATEPLSGVPGTLEHTKEALRLHDEAVKLNNTIETLQWVLGRDFDWIKV